MKICTIAQSAFHIKRSILKKYGLDLRLNSHNVELYTPSNTELISEVEKLPLFPTQIESFFTQLNNLKLNSVHTVNTILSEFNSSTYFLQFTFKFTSTDCTLYNTGMLQTS